MNAHSRGFSVAGRLRKDFDLGTVAYGSEQCASSAQNKTSLPAIPGLFTTSPGMAGDVWIEESHMQTVKLKVNDTNLIQNLRYAFVDKEVFVAELMQNARRAGATFVEFQWDQEERVLSVHDNGEGLKDPQNILTIAESGWSEETKAHEQPFGMGFMSAIYQADHVTIESCGARLHFKTEDAIGFQPISVVDCDTNEGTVIKLRGVPDLPYEDIVEWYARGFPIDIQWNGHSMKRPHAMGHRSDWIETNVGAVSLAERDDEPQQNPIGTTDTLLYLQGLPVGLRRPQYFRRSVNRNIVHLDARRFRGRMPDRSHLQNEEEAYEIVRRVIRVLWRRNITLRTDSESDERLACNWYPTLEKWGMLELLNAVDILPPRVIEQWSEYPVQSQEWEDIVSFYPDKVLRSEVESGRVRVVAVSSRFYDEDDGWQLPMYLYALRLPVLQGALDEGHWIHQHVYNIDQEDIRVECAGNLQDAHYCGFETQFPVTFARSVGLAGPFGQVQLQDATLVQNCWFRSSGLDFWLDDPLVVVPDAETDGEVVRQFSSFVSEYGFEEEPCDREQEEFSRFILSTREGRPCDLLYRVLDELQLQSYVALVGQAFRLEVDGSGIRVRLEDPVPQIASRRRPMIIRLQDDRETVEIYTPDEQGRYSRAYTIDKVCDLDTVIASYIGNFGLQGDVAKDILVSRLTSLDIQVVTAHELGVFLSREFGYPADTARDPVLCHYRYPESADGWSVRPVVQTDDGNLEPRWSEDDERPVFCWTVYQCLQDGTEMAVLDCVDEGLARDMFNRMSTFGVQSVFQ